MADNFPPAHATADYRFHDAANEARGAAAFVEEYLDRPTVPSELCALLREVAGNPFEPATEQRSGGLNNPLQPTGHANAG